MIKRNKFSLTTSVIITLIILSIYLLNYYKLQKPLNDIIRKDSVIKDLNINIHYKYYVDFSDIVISLKSFTDSSYYPHIFNILWIYSYQIKKYDNVKLNIGDDSFTYTLKEQIGLQDSMISAIESDDRNKNINVFIYFLNLSDSMTVVYDLQSVDLNKSMADIFRVFLQFAERVKSFKFENLIFSYKGYHKFKIRGDYFQKLGEEYSWQNPVYTTRTMPVNIYTMDGKKAYHEWYGGFIGVSLKELEDFNDFHKKWWLNDLIKENP